jgi:hypothetical protein
MMSPIRNIDENLVRNPQELLNFAQRPEVMPQLQRGAYLGSWFDADRGGLVVDPSRRFATRTGSLIQGLRSDQKAGFDLRRMEEFPVSRGALAQQLGTVAPMAAIGGISGAAAGEEAGVNPLLAGLAGTALGAAGGSAAARFARTASIRARRGVLDLGTRQRLEAAGVPVVAREAGVAVKEFLKSSGVDDAAIQAIPDNANEGDAWRSAYKILLEKNEKAFGGLSKEVKEARKVELAGRIVDDFDPASDEVGQIVSRGSGVPFKTAENKMLDLSPELKAVGVRKVRHVGSGSSGKGMDPLESLDRLPEPQRREAAVDILHNLERFVDDGSVAAAKARGGNSIFYTTMMAQRRAMAANLNEPVLLNAIRAGIASHKSSPMKETAKVAASVASRATGKSAGKMIDDINVAVDRVVDDMVGFLTNPRSLYGGQDKVLNYLATQIGAMQRVTSVIDSWMVRAAMGNKTLATTGNPGGYGIVDQAVSTLAAKYGVSPATMQEIIWNNVRIAAGESGSKAFAGLGSRAVKFPDIPMTEVVPSGSKSLDDYAKNPKNVELVGKFKTRLVEAVEQNPELAKYFELSGEDINFTDDFFRVLQSMQTRESGLAEAARAGKASAAAKKASDLSQVRMKMSGLERSIASSRSEEFDGITQESYIKYIGMLKDKKNPLHKGYLAVKKEYGDEVTDELVVQSMAQRLDRARKYGVPREFAEDTVSEFNELDVYGLITEEAYVNGMETAGQITSEFFQTAPRSLIDGLKNNDETALMALNKFLKDYDFRLNFDPATRSYLDEPVLNSLPPAAKDTFFSLLPEWDGSLLELLDVAKSLSA